MRTTQNLIHAMVAGIQTHLFNSIDRFYHFFYIYTSSTSEVEKIIKSNKKHVQFCKLSVSIGILYKKKIDANIRSQLKLIFISLSVVIRLFIFYYIIYYGNTVKFKRIFRSTLFIIIHVLYTIGLYALFIMPQTIWIYRLFS